MHIRMRTLLAGPSGVFPQGSLQQVDEEQGQALIEAGYAELASAQAVEVEVEAPSASSAGTSSEADTGELDHALIELVGLKPAALLARNGFQTVEAAQSAIAEGLDLTEIKGIGRATVRKLSKT